MCEFCHKHGEGRKWYLEAKNYSADLLSDTRRREFLRGFLAGPADVAEGVGKLERMANLPSFVRRVLAWKVSRQMKKLHFGQVVPIEEIEQIFGFANSIVRLACVCRLSTVGNEQRYCYGVSMGPEDEGFGGMMREATSAYFVGPDFKGLETLSAGEAIAAFKEHEKEGLCHTVWTFVTPFIGGICNCDRSDCLAMRATLTYQLPMMFRAEYVAAASPDLCNGCRMCMRVCQFGAIGYGAALQKAVIDPRKCYGCGICRAVCAKNAITLGDRVSVAAAADLW